jgi:spermidine synthase
MSASPDSFVRGLTRAVERRRAMQQQTMQEAQVVDKADDNNYVITTNVTAKTLSDEQYKQTMVQNMIALIHKRKMKND